MGIEKIDFKKLVQELVDEVDVIESQNIPQEDKTRKYQSAAKKFKNKLFMDKRRYRGKTLEKRITLGTFNTYLSRARKKFDEKIHHRFNNRVNKLIEKYPLYSDELKSWLNMPVSEIRKRHSLLKTKLMDIQPLSEEYHTLKMNKDGAEKRLQRLSIKFKSWQFELANIAGDDWNNGQDFIFKMWQQGVPLLDELMSLKINHEVMYHLIMTSGDRATQKNQSDNALNKKKNNIVKINYPTYMQRVYDILMQDEKFFDGSSRIGMAPLAFALAALSGRRMIEIMFTGEFKKVGKFKLEFKGQAKKRTDDDQGRIIYTLCDSELFIKKIKLLRSFPAAADFEKIISEMDADETRSEKNMLNAVLAPAFNPWVKKFFDDERRIYKDSRAIYARIAYQLFYKKDPRWNNVDEDVFFAELLGHEDQLTQLYYKQFQLVNFSESWRPDFGDKENPRLEALQDIDDQMPDYARGDAAVRLHAAVKQMVAENPDVVITTYALRKAGFNPTMVARYINDFSAVLGMERGANGRVMLVEIEKTPIVIIDDEPEDDADDVENCDHGPAQKNSESQIKHGTATDEKPRFSAPSKQPDGQWLIKFIYDGRTYSWVGLAKNQNEAMRMAWDNYFS